MESGDDGKARNMGKGICIMIIGYDHNSYENSSELHIRTCYSKFNLYIFTC
jgi:hypothetical protein